MTTRPDPAALLAQVLKLPRTHEMVIPTDYLDFNGHMNVMYYTAVGNFALVPFFRAVGVNPSIEGERGEKRTRGMFALRQVLTYMHELRAGEKIAVHSGLVGHDAKRIHFIHYIVSLDRHRVASSDERLAIYIDLTVRRSTDFEPEIVERLDRMKAEYAELGWQPQLSGAIKLKHH